MAQHISVLTDEVVEGLALAPDAVVVDCTFGSGGHAAAILKQLSTDATYLGIDADPRAIEGGQGLQSSAAADVRLVVGNFRDITRILERERIPAPSAMLADLGWRSEQFARGGKGFSFDIDEPLVMTYGDAEEYPFTAHDIANNWEEESIADIVYNYGEERAARRIAHAIVAARDEAPIETSKQLADIVTAAIPPAFRPRRINPATKTFQAFRIAVNDELGVLTTLLSDGFDALAPGGRLAIIAFHSLEDRIVKRTMRTLVHDQRAVAVTTRPITATEEELAANPRARSAKLRIIEKT